MSHNIHQTKIQRALAAAGIELNGKRPWDPQIHDERLYRELVLRGSLGLGEAYVAGWWDCDALDQLFDRGLRAGFDRHFRGLPDWTDSLLTRYLNRQSPTRSLEVATRHYDLGNDLFEAMLDSRMIYTCGYWRTAATLDEAQEAKLRLVGEKLDLKPGMRVLDIGCGWGGAARFLAEQYQVEVVGITVSEEQVAYAQACSRGLPVEIRFQDYRDLNDRYDRIYSLGMFEHVGHRNYEPLMRIVRERLAPDGLFLLHTIGSNATTTYADPWMARYIFPNSMLPSVKQIGAAIEPWFVLEDWHSFGADYDRTLMQWSRNVEERWERLPNYDETFHRLWRYYLRSCAGSFRARRTQLWQIVLSPNGVTNGYHSRR